MVPIPPPPRPRRDGIPVDDQSAGIGDGPTLQSAPIHPRPGQLTRGWRSMLIVGWAMAIYGLSAAGQGGDQVGKPPWWLARGFFVPLPFLLPIAAAAFAAANHRWSRRVGLLAAAAIGVVAVIDRIDSPGVAAAEGVTALIGVLCTLAATAGRVPPVSG